MPQMMFPEILRLEISFTSAADINMDAWCGAVLRNNFLYAASLVETDGRRSLFDIISECPLDACHPMYGHFSGGFPKPFLFDIRSLCHGQGYSSFRISAGNVYTFGLNIIGSHMRYYEYYLRAVVQAFGRGIGHPRHQLILCDVNKCGPVAGGVYCPVTGEDNRLGVADAAFTLHTPMSLCQPEKRGSSARTYQDKMNGFPSFYQIVRSLHYRMATLNMLYGEGLNGWDADALADFAGDCALCAGRAELQEAKICKCTMTSTRKKGIREVYKMCGYAGKMKFSGVYKTFIPLLKWGEMAGVGDDIGYGLGQYSVKVL